MHHPTPTESLPDVVFDLVEFGLYAVIGVGPEFSFETLFRNLSKMSKSRPRPADKYISVQFPLPQGGHATAKLFLQTSPGTVQIQSGSSIKLNLLRMLRQEFGDEACGPCGLDRKNNVIGQTDQRAGTLLERQLELAGAAIEHVTDLIADATETAVEILTEELWLRSAEACQDLGIAHPKELLKRLQTAPMPGVTRTVKNTYGKPSAHDDGLPCVRWRRPKTGPWYKVYIKRNDLVRVEVCCPDRKAVTWRLGANQRGSAINAGEVVRQLQGFAEAIEPNLHELKAHALSAVSDDATSAELHIALLPLTLLAGHRKAGQGRPISDSTRDAAKEALERLLMGGHVELSLLGSAPTLKKALESMCSSDGPLQRRGRRAIYVLAPKFAKAAQQL